MDRYTISSNSFSHDVQVADALAWLRIEHPHAYCDVRREFPEALIYDGSRIDTDTMNVNPDYTSWLADRIEQTGLVEWDDGESYGITESGELH